MKKSVFASLFVVLLIIVSASLSCSMPALPFFSTPTPTPTNTPTPTPTPTNTPTSTPTPTPTLTPTPTSTPTPVPLTEMLLRELVLQAEDIPSEFVNHEVADFATIWKQYDDVHTLVDKQYVIKHTVDGQPYRLLQNGIILYETEQQARRAYQTIIMGVAGTSVDIDPLGDEWLLSLTQIKVTDTSLLYVGSVFWRYHSAVIWINLLQNDRPVPAHSVESLARLVQERLDGHP